ncbi:MAG: OmpA family protein [Gammaproteobacteria bacterium]
MQFWKQAALGVIALSLVACAADDPNRRAKTGAAIGAVVGAVLGNQSDHDTRKRRILGAAIGAMAGAAVGSYMDKQQAELEARLKAEREREELQITRLPDNSLKVGIASEATFDVDRSDLKPSAYNTFGKIAGVLKTYDKTVIHVVGHTDSTGSDEYNQALSERRAVSVGNYLLSQGIPGDRLMMEGRGEREPRASNATPEGRRLNRRVDIVIKPIIEGQEERAFDPPPPLNS